MVRSSAMARNRIKSLGCCFNGAGRRRPVELINHREKLHHRIILRISFRFGYVYIPMSFIVDTGCTAGLELSKKRRGQSLTSTKLRGGCRTKQILRTSISETQRTPTKIVNMSKSELFEIGQT